MEYFEDLRNVNHCEFVVMKQNQDNGKYILQNQLRTWSELKKQAEAHRKSVDHSVPIRTRWTRRQNTTGDFDVNTSVPRAEKGDDPGVNSNNTERDSPVEDSQPTEEMEDNPVGRLGQPRATTSPGGREATPRTGLDGAAFAHTGAVPHFGRDGGGSRSGAATPAEGFSDDSDFPFFEKVKKPKAKPRGAIRELGHGHADALGDHDGYLAEPDEAEEIERQERRDRSVRGSVF